jgi:predicted MFS family arabinose efflux permease
MKLNNKLLWIYLLSSAIYFTQGIEGLPGLALFFFLKEKLGYTPEKIMFISSIIGMAWIIKVLYGYLCDNFLSNKKWILISLLGSIGIALYFGLSTWMPLFMIIIIASLANFNSALRDVSVDGIMCIDGKKENNCNRIQAIQWISITIASIIVGLAGGYIADHFTYKFAYLCLIPIYLIIIAIVLRYRANKEKKLSYINPILNKYKNPQCGNCIYRIQCKIHNINLCENYKEEKVSFLKTIYSYKELFTNKQFLIACLFLFLYKYSPSFGTPLAFIERDIFKWSGTWMGTLGAIISCFEVIGAIVFFKICKKINIKRWLYISVFLGACTTLCYLYFTPLSAIVYGILFAIIGMLVHLIIMSFMANSTISGKEATSFALLCSVSNLAGTSSSLSGAWLYPIVGLKWLIVISSVTSFICIPLIKHLNIKEKNE